MFQREGCGVGPRESAAIAEKLPSRVMAYSMATGSPLRSLETKLIKENFSIGKNDFKAAKGLKFDFEKFPNNGPEEQGVLFVEWCRQ